ncbi:response regulator [Maricaulis sp.]|uniref:response regulator n=1 Tax=Maricaulis sp. TaxID=1486257 RepID=UPI00263855B1|nr:response regulator [Maricaulis sp.]
MNALTVPASRPPLQRAPALLLEGNGFMRSLTGGLLRDAGFRNVLVVSSVHSARYLMRQHNPGLILTDWNRAAERDEDRLRLIRSIREDEQASFRTAPIVMITAPKSRSEVEIARDAGVTEFLVTPLSPAILRQRLSSLSERPRDFITAARFSGPDRRRRPLHENGPALKRTADVEAGRTTPMAAARAASVALADEMIRTGDGLAIRVARSQQRFINGIDSYGEREAEIVEMHRAAIAQLARLADEGNPLREPVVTGLEQVVARRTSDHDDTIQVG